jgi:hypothetical protein
MVVILHILEMRESRQSVNSFVCVSELTVGSTSRDLGEAGQDV